MAKALEDAETAEAEAIKAYDALMAAKEKEVEALNAQIEEKLTRKGELGVELAGGVNELEDTEISLAEDEKFLSELGAGCATKEKEWAEVCKTRQQELVALAETIKILNDDDALELFKKTLPSAASLLQVTESEASLRNRALSALKNASRRGVAQPQLDLIALALKGKTQGFENVIKMIDEMVVNLKKEQTDDEAKKEYCDKEFDVSEDTKKRVGAESVGFCHCDRRTRGFHCNVDRGNCNIGSWNQSTGQILQSKTVQAAPCRGTNFCSSFCALIR